MPTLLQSTFGLQKFVQWFRLFALSYISSPVDKRKPRAIYDPWHLNRVIRKTKNCLRVTLLAMIYYQRAGSWKKLREINIPSADNPNNEASDDYHASWTRHPSHRASLEVPFEKNSDSEADETLGFKVSGFVRLRRCSLLNRTAKEW